MRRVLFGSSSGFPRWRLRCVPAPGTPPAGSGWGPDWGSAAARGKLRDENCTRVLTGTQLWADSVVLALT